MPIQNEIESQALEQKRKGFCLENSPYFFVMKVFMSKWKPFIIHAMIWDDCTRYSRFKRQLPITDKVLAENLKELENDEIIIRVVYPEVPPKVEYRLTEIGKSICPILDSIYDWGRNEMKRRDLPICKLGEMWHGYRKANKKLMESPHWLKSNL